MFNRIRIKVIGFIAILMLGIGLISDSGIAETNPNPSANQPPVAALSQPQSQPIREPTPLPFWFEKAEEIWRDYLSKAETASSDDQRRQNSDLDAQWAMAYAAIAMTFFTLLQLIVGSITLYFLWRTFHETRRTADAGIDAAKNAQDQTRIIGAQTDIVEKQHAIGRLEFLASHRPHLRARHIEIFFDEIGNGEEKIPRLIHGQTLPGQLVIVNFGGSKTTVIESKYCMFFSKNGLPLHSPLDKSSKVLISPKTEIEVGESITVSIEDAILLNPNDARESAFISAGWTLYVMGQIRYQDEGGNDRFMGFCREWSGAGTFKIVKDRDYEYED